MEATKLDKIVADIKSARNILSKDDIELLKKLNKYAYTQGGADIYSGETVQEKQIPYTQINGEIAISRRSSNVDEEVKFQEPYPLWLKDVCKDHQLMNVKFNEKALQPNKTIAIRKCSKELNPDYPFLAEIKSMMYASGDYQIPDEQSAKTMHFNLFIWINELISKIKEYNLQLIESLRILYPCEYKMFEQSFNYRKIIKMDMGEEIMIDEDNENAEDIEKYYTDKYLFSPKLMDKECKRNERMIFQYKRAEGMTIEAYKEYTANRETTLLKQGKKKLTSYIKADIRDHKAIEFLSYLAKEYIEDVIELSLLKRDGKLMITTNTIESHYIEEISNKVTKKHIEKLEKLILKIKAEKRINIEVSIDQITQAITVTINKSMLKKKGGKINDAQIKEEMKIMEAETKLNEFMKEP